MEPKSAQRCTAIGQEVKVINRSILYGYSENSSLEGGKALDRLPQWIWDVYLWRFLKCNRTQRNIM